MRILLAALLIFGVGLISTESYARGCSSDFSCSFGDSVEYFFFASIAGGQSILLDGQEVTVITAQSPLAGRLIGLKAGDSFFMPNGSTGQILTIE